MRWLSLPLLCSALAGASPARAQTSPPDAEPTEVTDADRAERDGWSLEGPYALEIHLRAGASLRVDEPARYELTSPGGGTVEAGLSFAFSRRIALDLRYARATLGAEASGLLESGDVELSRQTDAAWLLLRLAPFRGEGWSIPLHLGPALAWQHVDASILTFDPVRPEFQSAIRCSATGMGFGLRGALGAIVDLAEGLQLHGDVGVDGMRLGDDVLDGCAPGAGTATVVGIRVGLGYRFPLGDE